MEELLTGIRNLPSRMFTEASASVMPASWACLSMAPARLEMAASFERMALRISCSLSEAESLMSPYLSRMPSILRCTSGNDLTGEAMRFSSG